MSKNDSCKNCLYWRQKQNAVYGGECHRYAPHPHDSDDWFVWPSMPHDAWCGEHKAAPQEPEGS